MPIARRLLLTVIRTVSRPKPASIGRNREIADELFETRAVLDKTEIELIDAGLVAAETAGITVGEGRDDHAGSCDRSVALLADLDWRPFQNCGRRDSVGA